MMKKTTQVAPVHLRANGPNWHLEFLILTLCRLDQVNLLFQPNLIISLVQLFQLTFHLQLILRFLLLSLFHPLLMLHQPMQPPLLRLRLSLLPPTFLLLPTHGLFNPVLAQIPI